MKGDQVLTHRREPPSSREFSPPTSRETKRLGRPRDNDRAIELSERGHVELVLYARGLELERAELLQTIRSARERLRTLARTTQISGQVREALQELLKTLEKRV
jgi:hypothetical protein